MSYSPFQNLVFPLAVMMLCYGTPALSITPDDIEKRRREVKEAALNSQVGSFYGYIISFSSVPDISASNLEIDMDGHQDTLDVFKIPWHYKVETNSETWGLTLRTNLNYASFKDSDAILITSSAEDSVEAEWQTFSGSLGALAEFPLNRGFSLSMGMDFGIASFKNEARYHGEVASSVVKPLLESILLDWETNATVVNAILGLDYKRVANQFFIDLKGRYVHARVDSFGESHDFSGFTADTDVLTIIAEISHPLEMTFRNARLSGVFHLDHTTFLGTDNDLAGFSSLSGVGFSIKADIAERDWYIESLQIGAKYLTGDNVRGWSLIFGYRF